MPTKNLFVLLNDQLGGAENVLKMVALETKSRGDKVEVFFLSSKKTTKWADCNYLYNKYSGFKSYYLGVLSLMIFLIRNRGGYNYVFSSHVFTNGILGFFRKLSLLKTNFLIARESTSIFKRYSGFRLLFYKFFYYLGYNKTDLLICQSEQMEDDFRINFSKLSKNITVVTIPNPFAFPATTEQNTSETEVINQYKPYIISAGRMIPEKGFDILLEAFVLLKDKHPDLHLVILGVGPEKIRLQEIMQKHHLDSKVFFPGHEKNVYPWFKNAKVCVVSSRIEGFPNVLLQMMSQNGKVVSTLCAGGIENLKGVIKTKVGSVKMLYNSIDLAIESNTCKNSERIFHEQLEQRSVFRYIKMIKQHLEDNPLD